VTRAEAESLLTSNGLPYIRAMARSFARRSGLDFNELVQSASLTVWEALLKYDPARSSIGTYLYWPIMRGFAQCKHSRISRETRDLFSIEDYRNDDGENNDNFESLIACLKPQQRVAVRLTFRDGMTAREVASRMHYSHQRVSQMLDAALELLRWRWGETARAA
jgi:RNA polymerase sigma factor (sigma-70 family)